MRPTLATLGSTNPLFWELHRKPTGKTLPGGFYWLSDRVMNDLGSITNLPSGKTHVYTLCVYFKFSRGTLTRKENHGLRLNQFLHNIMQVATAFIFLIKKIMAKSKHVYFSHSYETKGENTQT